MGPAWPAARGDRPPCLHSAHRHPAPPWAIARPPLLRPGWQHRPPTPRHCPRPRCRRQQRQDRRQFIPTIPRFQTPAIPARPQRPPRSGYRRAIASWPVFCASAATNQPTDQPRHRTPTHATLVAPIPSHRGRLGVCIPSARPPPVPALNHPTVEHLAPPPPLSLDHRDPDRPNTPRNPRPRHVARSGDRPFPNNPTEHPLPNSDRAACGRSCC